jgi:hypothetical protein
MADYDSSLPIRTEAAGDVDIFISDSVTPSQKLKVNADGSIDTNTSLPAGTKVIITDGTDDLAVNADGSVNAIVSATDLDIRDLSQATDSVTAHQGGTWSVDVANTVTVQATDLDIRDLTAASDSVAAHLFDEAGNAFSSSNPLPVEFFESKAEVFNFSQGTNIAKNASHTHTFAAPADFKLKDVYVSGSGKLRAELKIDGNTVAVGFNSTANPQVTWRFQKGLNASSVNVVVEIENKDNQAQDLYSTIVGLS